jgi:tRNA (adenine22-N1)-methyltransferase
LFNNGQMVESLSPRLAAVAAQVPKRAVLADVGTDHAHLPSWLLGAGKIDTAIALDIADGPLARARVTAAGTRGALEVRKSDGLIGLAPGEASCISICGMGGLTIADILTRGANVWQSVERVLIQPQGMEAEARVVLLSAGWGCVSAELVAEKKHIYVVEAWAPAAVSRSWSSQDLRWGRIIRTEPDPLFSELLERESRNIKQGLQRLSDAGQAGHSDAQVLKQELTQIEQELSRVLAIHG